MSLAPVYQISLTGVANPRNQLGMYSFSGTKAIFNLSTCYPLVGRAYKRQCQSYLKARPPLLLASRSDSGEMSVEAPVNKISLTEVANPTNQLKNCIYTIVVKTGTVLGSGTNAKISCILKDAQGGSVGVSNLEEWGLMDNGHDYFENGNVETFVVAGPCLQSPVCELTLISDGTGFKPGWYVEYVKVVTSTGKTVFEVYGWLAESEPPYSLTRTFYASKP